MQRVLIGWAALFLLTASLAAPPDQPDVGPTPPRLSLVDGPVSFWRPGAGDWSTAALNTPLAAGDALYAGERANLELQIGGRAYVRAGERTQLTLVNRDSNYLQFRIADGQAAIDLRAMPAGVTVEVDTPNAAFTIDRSGYYRLNVDRDTTLFITRRGGRATVLPLGGQARSVAPAEELVVEGSDAPRVETYIAPDLDAWDEWNYARGDHLVDALSQRYLPPDVYGADALDHYGDWRLVPDYGTVWVPSGLPADWAPYSSGHWIWDPFYGWTWIDDAPWGWAPFHYGRWVYLGGFWGWTPGAVTAQSVYAPALVAFFDSRDGAVAGFDAGSPALSWVALSWGEPLIPWWGRRGFIGVPWWGGWGGPRRINSAATAFQNARVANAMIGVRRDQFGHGSARGSALPASALANLTPMAGALTVKPSAASLSIGAPARVRPPQEVLSRPTVTLRAPQQPRLPWRAEAAPAAATAVAAPELRFVPPPQRRPSPSASFGTQLGSERPAPSPPPRFEELRRREVPAAPPPELRERMAPSRVETVPAVSGRERLAPANVEPSHGSVRPEPRPSPPETFRQGHREEFGSPVPEAAPNERGHEEGRALPGNPANRMAPRRRAPGP